MLWKEILCKTWIVFILIKCICFIIKINHVRSHVEKHCFLKNNNIVFQHVHFFIQLFWNEKLSLCVGMQYKRRNNYFTFVGKHDLKDGEIKLSIYFQRTDTISFGKRNLCIIVDLCFKRDKLIGNKFLLLLNCFWKDLHWLIKMLRRFV